MTRMAIPTPMYKYDRFPEPPPELEVVVAEEEDIIE
jgi:hypothetical protein